MRACLGEFADFSNAANSFGAALLELVGALHSLCGETAAAEQRMQQQRLIEDMRLVAHEVREGRLCFLPPGRGC